MTGLAPNTAYNWRVTGECSSSYSAEATFTSGDPVYCTPLYSDNGCNSGIGIRQVVLNNITLSDNSGCSPTYFTSYTSPVGTLSKTSPNSFTVGFLDYFTAQQIVIWIDFDQSYDFESTELVYATTQSYTTPVVASFTLPAGVASGVTRRMRIRNQFSFSSPITTACGTLGYGETEDYLVFIPSDCPPVPTITQSATMATCQQSTSLAVTNCPGTVVWEPSGTGSSIVVNPTQTTNYTVTCIANGCSTSQTATLSVLPNTVSVQSGNWDNSATWSCNQVPSAVTPVTIASEHIVTMPASVTGAAKSVTQLGRLTFSDNAKLILGAP